MIRILENLHRLNENLLDKTYNYFINLFKTEKYIDNIEIFENGNIEISIKRSSSKNDNIKRIDNFLDFCKNHNITVSQSRDNAMIFHTKYI